ncbi:hypothetical protein [Streptomyces sp. NPDC016845]|uniref:hypothetical protein n=1 Tax=Streptomyces sp. NPDC016845 TaxID=3364972 RepID=UPI0037BDFBDF
MQKQLRRLALAPLAVLALALGVVAVGSAASAATHPVQAVPYPGPSADSAYPGDDDDDDDDEPLHFGPFDVPHEGEVNGTFSWNTRD